MSPAHRLRIPLILVLAALAVLFAGSVGHAEDEAQIVVMVDVEGNQLVPKEEILAVVKTIRIGAQINLEAVRTDQQAIYDLGYFAAPPAPEYRKALGGVEVVFHVIEYPPLKEVVIKGLTKMPAEEAMAVFTTKPGQVINRVVLVQDLIKLRDKAQADYGLLLKSPAQRITPEGVVEIEFIEMRLGAMTFTGLEKTKENTVRRELSAQAGEIFNLKTFTSDLQRLFMMGFFETIEPKFNFDTGTADTLDIQIDFKERKTASVMLGVNYATSDNEWSGLVKVSDTNLFGTGNSLSGGIELNPNKRNFDISYTNPWLDSSHTSLNLHVYSNFDGAVVADVDDGSGTLVLADESLRGFEVGVGRPIGRNFTASIVGRHQLLSREEDGSYAGDPVPNPPLLTPGDVVTNSLALQLDYKSLTPQKSTNVYVADGFKAKLSTEFAGGFLSGDTEFQRYSLESAVFKSFSDRDVLALRVMGGLVDIGDDPMETSYFLTGGAETLRGYDYRAFSSTRMALANLEYRHRFNDTLEGVLFYDQGAFYNDSLGWQQGSGYGAGMRVWVPFLGQLRFDYAWRTDTSDGTFYFSIGELF